MKTKIAPIIGYSELVVNTHGLHVTMPDGFIPVDGIMAYDYDVHRHYKRGMNETMFANTRIHPYTTVINNTIIKFYEE